jgi:hypothetical protein
LRKLRVQPIAMLGEKTVAGDQAGTLRQGEAHAAFADRELDPPRARIAHAQHVHIATVVQPQRYAVALLTGSIVDARDVRESTQTKT